MDLKDGLNEVKKELSGDEKLLEQAFHLEKFFKKYKTPLIATAVVLVLALAGYKVNNYLENQRLERANSALLALDKNPKDSSALKELKENNPKLYALYSYSVAANAADKDSLNSLDKDSKFLDDVVNYNLSLLNNSPKNSIYYKNLSIVEKAYLLIKDNKKSEAKNSLATIDKNSAVVPIARLLEHYTITK